MTLKEINEKLKGTLKPSRYRHSVSVAKTAARLAEIYGADKDKAYLAGLVHDCAKNYTMDELFAFTKEFSLEIDEISKVSWGLVHGFVGAELALREYGIDDEEIYDAIYYHTIGKANMPLLTKIIYLADGIEPLRSYEGVKEIRLIAEKNIDRAVVMYTNTTIKHVINRNFLLHPAAVETRNYYIQRLKQAND